MCLYLYTQVYRHLWLFCVHIFVRSGLISILPMPVQHLRVLLGVFLSMLCIHPFLDSEKPDFRYFRYIWFAQLTRCLSSVIMLLNTQAASSIYRFVLLPTAPFPWEPGLAATDTGQTLSHTIPCSWLPGTLPQVLTHRAPHPRRPAFLEADISVMRKIQKKRKGGRGRKNRKER